jgi:uncharacterized membrane protein YphA (DoxX/SURF4 family)
MQQTTSIGLRTYRFFIGHLLPNNSWLNAGWLLLRVHVGLSLAIHAGWPKMADGLAPDWFIKQVGEIGFTVISPAFWATVASWGEFVGGLLLALGFLTRFNALQLLFQFFVISFIWYDEPEPITGMYFQQTLFMCYLLFAIGGGGRFSLDAWFAARRQKTGVSKKPISFNSLNA